jgi:Raf kinase inhibitor-like YbhB/YbcL family protein
MNPELQIQNVPESAKSLALIMHDPDAPMPGGFTHWVVWNIKPTTMLIKDESIPPGSIEGANGRGDIGYTGPMPPPGHGDHHYEFRLYALGEALDLPEGATKADLEAAMEGHIIERTLLVGTYKRE